MTYSDPSTGQHQIPSSGWAPPRPPRPALRPRADRRAQAVSSLLRYLALIDARDVALSATPWRTEQLRRDGPELIAYLARLIAALPDRRGR